MNDKENKQEDQLAVNDTWDIDFMVTFEPFRIAIDKNGVSVLQVFYEVATDPDMRNVVYRWFSWTGAAKGLKPLPGQFFNMEIMRTFQKCKLKEGKIYFKRATAHYNIDDGGDQFTCQTATEAFQA
jgi:hypothetical protein